MDKDSEVCPQAKLIEIGYKQYGYDSKYFHDAVEEISKKFCDINPEDKYSNHLYLELANHLYFALYKCLYHIDSSVDDKLLSKEMVEKFITINTKILGKTLGKEDMTRQRNLSYAKLVSALEFYGSSQSQAIKAVAEWTRKSANVVKLACSKCKIKDDYKSMSDDEFSMVLIPFIFPMVKKYGRSFPSLEPSFDNKNPKASFDALLAKLDSVYDEGLRPLQIKAIREYDTSLW